jgi:serine acetyltransferase
MDKPTEAPVIGNNVNIGAGAKLLAERITVFKSEAMINRLNTIERLHLK